MWLGINDRTRNLKENCWFYSAVVQKMLYEKCDGVLVAGRAGQYCCASATTRAIDEQFRSSLRSHV